MQTMQLQAHHRLQTQATEFVARDAARVAERDRYRRYFLELYGPGVLRGLSDAELLVTVPLNLPKSGMDYTLEFMASDDFQQSAFGSIAGGSAGKYGVFRRQKEQTWWTREADPATEAQAALAVRRRVGEILAACAYLDSLAQVPVSDLDPDQVQQSMEQAAPLWHNSAWLHKYLHIYCPRLVTWNHARGHLQAELYRLGVVPHEADARYANDILALQFWSNLLQQPMLDATPHWDGVPREYWTFTVQSAEQSRELLADGALCVGPAQVGDLTDVYGLEQVSKIKRALEAEFSLAGLSPNLMFLEGLGQMKPYDVVVLVLEGTQALAVGEVAEAPYEYRDESTLPHRRQVRWLHDHPFQLAHPVADGVQRVSVKKQPQQAPLIETSLLAYAGGQWPEFEPSIEHQVATSSADSPRLQAPDDPVTREIFDILEKKGQVILYGPPGTGKTYFAEWAALELVARVNFKVERAALTIRHRKRALGGAEGAVPFISTCTFHPAYGYEDFIEGYRPTAAGGFELRDGVFKRVARAALDDPHNHYVLIVDEINRGNIPKILGELITLLELNKRERTSVVLPVSGEMFTVPKNLSVIATMNTADRSILLLDTALRRRFGFKELMPEPHRLAGSTLERVKLPLWLSALNRRIVEALGRVGRNLQVGHAYLMDNHKPVGSLDRLATVLRQELWPLLQEYCYEDSKALTAILGKAPRGLYDTDKDDLAWHLFEPGAREKLLSALESMIEPEDTESVEAGAEEA